MTKLETLAFLAFLATWYTLAGGGGCSDPTASTCPGSNPQTASSGTTIYSLNGQGLNATGVAWAPAYSPTGHSIETTGSGDACTYKGRMDGPVPNTAVFECYDDGEAQSGGNPYIHCPGGTQAGCPNPCFEYHQREGVEHATSGAMEYNRACIQDEGDGVSAKTATAGPIRIYLSWFRRVHDDVIEHDWCKDLELVGSYVENAFMVAATNPQTGLNVDCSQNTIKLINNVIRIVKFPNTYKQRPGHGGLWKTPALPNSPKRV